MVQAVFQINSIVVTLQVYIKLERCISKRMEMVCRYNRYIETKMTLVLVGNGLVLGELTFKKRGHSGPRYNAYIYIQFLVGSFNPCEKYARQIGQGTV